MKEIEKIGLDGSMYTGEKSVILVLAEKINELIDAVNEINKLDSKK